MLKLRAAFIYLLFSLCSALPKEYQKIGKALQSLALVFSTSGYQGIFTFICTLLWCYKMFKELLNIEKTIIYYHFGLLIKKTF